MPNCVRRVITNKNRIFNTPGTLLLTQHSFCICKISCCNGQYYCPVLPMFCLPPSLGVTVSFLLTFMLTPTPHSLSSDCIHVFYSLCHYTPLSIHMTLPFTYKKFSRPNRNFLCGVVRPFTMGNSLFLRLMSQEEYGFFS